MTERSHAYVRAAIDGEVARLTSAIEGERNQILFRATSALASLGLEEWDIFRHLRKPAEAIGLPASEIDATIRSGIKAGQSRPRDIPKSVSGASFAKRFSRQQKQPAFLAGDELPEFPDEVRRHRYVSRGLPIRIKVKRRNGTYVNWYRAVRGSDTGWQAAKPDGYVDHPYYAGMNPFQDGNATETVFWPEGEKDCDTLAAFGGMAFCFGGCGDGLPDFDTNILADRHVVILADNDRAGRAHAEQKAALVHSVTASVKVIHFPELPEKGDVSDWLAAGNSIAALRNRIDAAPTWLPPMDSPPVADTHDPHSAESRFSWSEPDTSIIDDRRGDLPELPDEVVPPSWRNWLTRSAHGAGVTEAHVFVPLLAIGSGLIGTARRVQASRSWTEPLTVWTAIVGFSGTGKTPGIDVTKRSLAEIQKLKSETIATLERKHTSKREEAKIARKIWADSVEEAVSSGLPAPAMPENAADLPPFTPPRLFVSDATVERLAVMLQSRPQGALYIADELAGLFLNMGRYTVDRIGSSGSKPGMRSPTSSSAWVAQRSISTIY